MGSPQPADDPTPETLLARWRDAGDASALGALFDATAPDLFRIALSVAPDPATAEDALQETFLAAMEAAPRVDLSRPLLPFLVGILRHKVEKARARARRVPDPARLPDPELRVEDPVRAAVRTEEAERVRRAILALPVAYRKAALLRWQHGLEPAEIAEILEKPPGTIWSLLSRARQKLKRVLTGVPVVVATGARSARGTGAVRRAVMVRAEVMGAATTGVGATLAAGGILVGKKTAVAAAALLVLGGGAWWWTAAAPGPSPSRGADAMPGTTSAAAPSGPSVDDPAASAAGTAPGTEVTDLGIAPQEGPSPGESNLRSGKVFGRLVDAERRPVEGATVILHLGPRVLGTTRSGPEGEFHIPEVSVDASVERHFRFCILARDDRGRAARHQVLVGVIRFDPGEDREVTLSHVSLGTLVLREAAPVDVVVTAGGSPVEGAAVWAEEIGEPGREGTEEVATDAAGGARIEAVPPGMWVVRARRTGRGVGETVVDLPTAGPVEVRIFARSLEILAVDAAAGTPIEGVRMRVLRRRPGGAGEEWEQGFPPLDTPATDSAGRALLAEAGEGSLRLLPLLPDGVDVVPGVEPVDVPEGALSVRVPVAGPRRIRWPVAEGDRAPPVEGARVTVQAGEAGTDGLALMGFEEPVEARVEGGDLVVVGLPRGAVEAVARAEDGSLARLSAAAGAESGAPARFHAPRRLAVSVRDEDGAAVGLCVALLSPAGTAVKLPSRLDAEGKTVFEDLLPGEVVVCALASTQWGGAEVGRVDLGSGDGRLDVVVGREFTVVLRLRAEGRPRIPSGCEVRILYPGPDFEGEPHFEHAFDVAEDADRGELRFRVRPYAPGKPVAVALVLPGRAPVAREVHPPGKRGGEVAVEIDLDP